MKSNKERLGVRRAATSRRRRRASGVLSNSYWLSLHINKRPENSCCGCNHAWENATRTLCRLPTCGTLPTRTNQSADGVRNRRPHAIRSLSVLEPTCNTTFSMFLSSCCLQQRRSIFLIVNHVLLCSQQMGRPFRRPSWSALRSKFSMRPLFDGRNRDPGVRHRFVALYSFNLPALQSRVSTVFASAAPTSARTSAKLAHRRIDECITKP